MPDDAIKVPFDVLEGEPDDKSKTKSEKFADVYKEFCDNVPDRTTSLEEKELALSYIDQLLACDDISPELANYWTNKKTIISFIDRVLNCSDLPADARKGYEDLRVKYVDEMNSYIAKSEIHNNASNPFKIFD